MCGPGSSVSIVTGYGLKGLGIESGGGEIFRTCSDWTWGPPSLLYNGYRVFPGGKERLRCDANLSPPSSAIGHERVELHLYSPCGPYGLYRASVLVQGCNLPFFKLNVFRNFLGYNEAHCCTETLMNMVPAGLMVTNL
jgi:hypothetical protein